MRIFAKRTLREFWELKPEHRDAKGALEAWHKEVQKAQWENSNALKAQFRSASFVKNRVVFNIAGSKYRLVVKVRYDKQRVFIKFIGTHQAYDQIDVGEI